LGLFSASADGGAAQPMTKPPSGTADIYPAVSPDGGELAFVRRTSTFNSNVFVMPLKRDGTSAGAAKPITSGVWSIGSVDWTADGREILFAGSTGSGNSSLWRMARDGGKPTRFPAPTMASVQLSVARQSGRMIYVTRQLETKIFKMPLGARPGAASPLIETDGDQRDLGVGGKRRAHSIRERSDGLQGTLGCEQRRLGADAVDVLQWAFGRQSALVAGREADCVRRLRQRVQ
jgi:hypothetical protein